MNVGMYVKAIRADAGLDETWGVVPDAVLQLASDEAKSLANRSCDILVLGFSESLLRAAEDIEDGPNTTFTRAEVLYLLRQLAYTTTEKWDQA